MYTLTNKVNKPQNIHTIQLSVKKKQQLRIVKLIAWVRKKAITNVIKVQNADRRAIPQKECTLNIIF